MIGSPVMDYFPMFATQANDGTLYFTGNVKRGIYLAEYRDGHFQKPQRLPKEINDRNWAGHPFIDPEGRYIIFDSNIDKKGTKNLFISFRDNNGDWTKSVNLNPWSPLKVHAAMPHVSFDGRYLFFTSRGDIYWVDARIIEELKPDK
jgi:Tol biopolymer transport system component